MTHSSSSAVHTCKSIASDSSLFARRLLRRSPVQRLTREPNEHTKAWAFARRHVRALASVLEPHPKSIQHRLLRPRAHVSARSFVTSSHVRPSGPLTPPACPTR